MSFGKITNTSDGDKQFEAEEVRFSELVHTIFEDSSSARLGRFVPVNQRTAQKWIARDGEGMPEEVRQRVSEQYDLYMKHYPRAKFLTVLKELEDAGLDQEVVASEISALYTLLTGLQIR